MQLKLKEFNDELEKLRKLIPKSENRDIINFKLHINQIHKLE